MNEVDERENFLALIDSLLDTYRPVGVLIWLDSRNSHLDDRKPRQLIAVGEWQPLLDEADRLAGGRLSMTRPRPDHGDPGTDTKGRRG